MLKFQILNRITISPYVASEETQGQKKGDTTKCLTSNLVPHLEWHSSDIVLYGHKLKLTNITSIHLDVFYQKSRGVEYY